jgi:hypothetical protein
MKTDLQSIPGVGKTMEQRLVKLGCESVAQLKGQSAEELYARDCAMAGIALDRCVLYVYRLAVYFAEGGREPEKLRWWNWKDAASGR